MAAVAHAVDCDLDAAVAKPRQLRPVAAESSKGSSRGFAGADVGWFMSAYPMYGDVVVVGGSMHVLETGRRCTHVVKLKGGWKGQVDSESWCS